MCRVERWSVRTLRHKIGHLLYERTAVSKKPDELIARDLAALRDEDRMTPDLVFRDPYFLDFLGLTGIYAEKDLEQAILRELEAFILELGSDFAFVARQKRITVDNEDYYLDLLFYHRRLRRLVAIELKLGPLPGRRQGADGAVSPLAGEARHAARRGAAAGPDPLRRQVRGARRAAPARQERHPRRPVPDGAAAPRAAGEDPARLDPAGRASAWPLRSGTVRGS